jgi:predicted ribosomally synthesized peptide with SipW-like signal peptide
MSRRILIALLGVLLVAALAGAGTFAYFSDTETSTGNTFTVGTIDISVDGENPWTKTFELEDLKPCETGTITFVVTNVGTNPADIYKHLTVTELAGGAHPESEWAEDPDDTINNIDEVMDYAILVNDASIYTGTVASANCNEILLGQLAPGASMTVVQTYHLQAGVTNWAQGDKMTFDIEVLAKQVVPE